LHVLEYRKVGLMLERGQTLTHLGRQTAPFTSHGGGLSPIQVAAGSNNQMYVTYGLAWPKSVDIWNRTDGERSAQHKLMGDVLTAPRLRDKQGLLSFAVREFKDKSVALSIWDAQEGRFGSSFALTGEPSTAPHMKLSRDGRLLAGLLVPDGSSDKYPLRVWNAQTGQVVRTLGSPLGAGDEIKFSPDGRVIASVSRPTINLSIVTLWEVDTGKQIHSFRVGSGKLEHYNAPSFSFDDIAFSDDGRSIVAFGFAGNDTLPNLMVYGRARSMSAVVRSGHASSGPACGKSETGCWLAFPRRQERQTHALRPTGLWIGVQF
jgi:WD40 repeat protein